MIKRAQLESVLFKHAQVPGVPTVSSLPNRDPDGDFNPINIGLKLGIAGAGAGLGFAALRTLIRRARGQNIMPGTSVKDVMIGALIGSTVGMGGATVANKMAEPMPDNVFKDFEDLVNKRMGKGPEVQAAPMLKTDSLGLPGKSGYGKIACVMSPALLISILETGLNKEAQEQMSGLGKVWNGIKTWGAPAAGIAAMFNPYTLAATSAYGLGKGIYEGGKKMLDGNIMGGLGAVGLGALTAIPFAGRFVRPLGKLMQAAGGARRSAKPLMDSAGKMLQGPTNAVGNAASDVSRLTNMRIGTLGGEARKLRSAKDIAARYPGTTPLTSGYKPVGLPQGAANAPYKPSIFSRGSRAVSRGIGSGLSAIGSTQRGAQGLRYVGGKLEGAGNAIEKTMPRWLIHPRGWKQNLGQGGAVMSPLLLPGLFGEGATEEY